MPNKFQQSVSVMERLEAEAKRQKKQAKESAPPEAAPENPLPPAAESAPQARAFSGQEVETYLRRPARRVAKNKTFYLDMDVADAVKETAGRTGVTESQLVNDILRGVLKL